MKRLRHGHNRAATNGVSGTYQSWKAMKARCDNKHNNRYQYYGAVGISYCEEWSFFEAFLRDMGERPENTSLDRIDRNEGYSKENCRWSSAFTQNRNRKLKKSKTGICGIRKYSKHYGVKISGKKIGFFEDYFDACCARKSAENSLWKEAL